MRTFEDGSRTEITPEQARIGGRRSAERVAANCGALLRSAGILGSAIAFLSSGCEGVQSSLQPSGADAARIAELWWLLFGVAVFVFVVVSASLVLAFFRSPVPEEEQEAQTRRLHRAIGFGAAATAALLVVIFVPTLLASRPFAASTDPAFTVRVTGKLFWWEVTYLDEDGSALFTTANELRIPTDRTVRVELVSDNVIHSLWVPRLAGKVDLVPGRTNHLTLHATEEGSYRGQCAEFCGIQHTNMALWVVATAPEAYAEWAERQRSPAVEPADAAAQRGQRVFVEAGCGECHTVRGVATAEEPGPDLTHVASRLSLAAGTLPNREGYLAGWVGNPQALKPGNPMPRIAIPSNDFRPLITYLGTLE